MKFAIKIHVQEYHFIFKFDCTPLHKDLKKMLLWGCYYENIMFSLHVLTPREVMTFLMKLWSFCNC